MARAIRSFTLERRVSSQLDQMVRRGERSRFVNQVLLEALEDEADKEAAARLPALAALHAASLIVLLAAGHGAGFV